MAKDEAAQHEAAQHEAEHKAAGLHRLGWQTGAGAAIWGRAVEDVLAQHEEARRSDPYLETFLYWTSGGGTNLSLATSGSTSGER